MKFLAKTGYLIAGTAVIVPNGQISNRFGDAVQGFWLGPANSQIMMNHGRCVIQVNDLVTVAQRLTRRDQYLPLCVHQLTVTGRWGAARIGNFNPPPPSNRGSIKTSLPLKLEGKSPNFLQLFWNYQVRSWLVKGYLAHWSFQISCR
jgi:hypothetical protein